MVPTDTVAPKKSVTYKTEEPKVKKSSTNLLLSKLTRISSTERGAAVPTASGSVGPGSTQGSEILVVETESRPFTPSCRNIPQRDSARAARLLLGLHDPNEWRRRKYSRKEKFDEPKTPNLRNQQLWFLTWTETAGKADTIQSV